MTDNKDDDGYLALIGAYKALVDSLDKREKVERPPMPEPVNRSDEITEWVHRTYDDIGDGEIIVVQQERQRGYSCCCDRWMQDVTVVYQWEGDKLVEIDEFDMGISSFIQDVVRAQDEDEDE